MIINPYAFGNPVCAYLFNATQTDIDAIFGPGSGVTPLPIIDGGKGIEFTPQTGLGTPTTTTQFNSPLSYSIDITSGKKAFELLFDFTSSGLDTNKAGASTETRFQLIDELGRGLLVSIDQREGVSNGIIRTESISGTFTTTVSSISSPVRVGVEIDADAGSFSITMNGTPVSLGVGGDELATGMYLMNVVAEETGGADSLDPIDSDKIVTMHLYTDSTDMTGTYPAGTTDICGNQIVIPQNLVFSSSSDGTNTDITESGRLWTVRTTATNATWHKAEVASAKTTGKWYYEVEVIWTMLVDAREPAIGIAFEGINTSSAQGGANNAGDGQRIQYFASGEKRQNGVYAAYGATYQNGDIIGIAFDGDAHTITAYKNGASQGVMYSGLSAIPYVPHFCRYHAVTGGGFRLKSSLLYLPSGYNVWT